MADEAIMQMKTTFVLDKLKVSVQKSKLKIKKPNLQSEMRSVFKNDELSISKRQDNFKHDDARQKEN